ncbi:hypothetical protein AURDEDRAFT_120909 [Auricularia subglabra TFB-10046 SS5]|nr:hypothetical protein AURDEDRAFT_120909 [Auricularia subglabra TFB-10046 SS5]
MGIEDSGINGTRRGTGNGGRIAQQWGVGVIDHNGRSGIANAGAQLGATDSASADAGQIGGNALGASECGGGGEPDGIYMLARSATRGNDSDGGARGNGGDIALIACIAIQSFDHLVAALAEAHEKSGSEDAGVLGKEKREESGVSETVRKRAPGGASAAAYLFRTSHKIEDALASGQGLGRGGAVGLGEEVAADIVTEEVMVTNEKRKQVLVIHGDDGKGEQGGRSGARNSAAYLRGGVWLRFGLPAGGCYRC